MSEKDELLTFMARINALQMLGVHLYRCKLIVDSAPDPVFDQIASELRDVFDGISERANKSLTDAALPVWGELPIDVREACASAGVQVAGF